MLVEIKWFAVAAILLVTLAGGYWPLAKRDIARRPGGFSTGQAFAAGVFLALALFMMFPAALHLFAVAFPAIHYPLAALGALAAFLGLLLLEHRHAEEEDAAREAVEKTGGAAGTAGEVELSSPEFPIIMTVMIAIPSFLLGAALGVGDDTGSVVMILVAILAHKGTAAFALVLNLVRSTLSPGMVYGVFSLFVIATPLGIGVGEEIEEHLLGPGVVITKAVILSLASGTFLYLATVHGLRHSAMIRSCATHKGFAAFIFGLALTALARAFLG